MGGTSRGAKGIGSAAKVSRLDWGLAERYDPEGWRRPEGERRPDDQFGDSGSETVTGCFARKLPGAKSAEDGADNRTDREASGRGAKDQARIVRIRRGAAARQASMRARERPVRGSGFGRGEGAKAPGSIDPRAAKAVRGEQAGSPSTASAAALEAVHAGWLASCRSGHLEPFSFGDTAGVADSSQTCDPHSADTQ